MPEVNPMVTGYGMNLMAAPSPVSPITMRRPPARTVQTTRLPRPYLAAMPDLVLTLAPGFASSPLQPGLWDNTGWGSGDHSLEGILVAHGSGIAPGRLEGAALVDVAPTALYLLDQPVPSTMDGQVLAGALDPALLAARPIRCRQQVPGDLAVREAQNGIELAPLTPEEEAEVQEHLRGLGYL